ncbi:hypothetical protein tb265_16340 [Gemmatimonadetes bacterium T265]|nr:hypothetical protein tb265_16340 [Gemmatimonadetes bacterium T265]
MQDTPPPAAVVADTPAVATAGVVPAGVVPGVEVLLRDSLHLVRGRRVGLITNPTGRDRVGTSTADLLARAPGVRLTALFGPEHGIRGTAAAGAHVASSVDSATGVPVYSLYGATRAPTREMLRDVDVLVYDIQDVGARVYTYVWTMALAAAAADSAGVPFVVLDRPDPVRADRVEGGVLDPRFASFVGQYPVAMRYGLTPGELLRYLTGTGRVHVSHLTVVPMRGYRRCAWYADTRLPRLNPSPNLRDADAELLYTGTVLFEGTNVSEGRGTDAPFTLVGAPWLADAPALAAALNARAARDSALGGVRFEAVARAVAAGTEKFGGQTLPMLRVVVTDRDRVRPDAVGLWMLRTIYAAHPREFAWRTAPADRLAGSDRMRQAVEGGDEQVAALLARYAEEAGRFGREAEPYRLYH